MTIKMKIVTKRINVVGCIRDARWEPQKSKSSWLGELLVVAIKRKEKEDDDQHEDCDQEDREQLQAPLRSKSQWLGGSLIVPTKRKKKEDNDQCEDHDQKVRK